MTKRVSNRKCSDNVNTFLETLRNWAQGRQSDWSLPDVDLTGSVAIVTGSNTGIGKETVRGLAERGATVIMACRSIERAQAAMEDIGLSNIKVKKCDLASFASVREFCRQVCKEEKKIDILINNAGMFSTQRTLTDDGQETVFQVNHLGHFLLTNLLLDKMKAAKAARIINVSSTGHWAVLRFPFDDPTFAKSWFYNGMSVYAITKLANILFTLELSKRLKGSNIQVFSLHPGGVNTDLGRNAKALVPEFVSSLFGKIALVMTLSAETGARTSLYCAMEPSLSDPKYSGKYFDNCQVGFSSPYAKNEKMAKKLWDLSAQLVKLD